MIKIFYILYYIDLVNESGRNMSIKKFLENHATQKMEIAFVELSKTYCGTDTFKNYALNLQQAAKSKLGKKHYNEVYDFFARIFVTKNEYCCIIAKARRAFMLVQIFCNIIANDIVSEKLSCKYKTKSDQETFDVFLQNCNKICTDIYLSSAKFFNVINCDTKILILDDILIHGRALMQLVQYLEQFYITNTEKERLTENIHVKTVVVHKDAECLPELSSVLCNDKYNDIASWRKYGESDTDWKQKSSAYVNLILYSGQSYAAFVDSYKSMKNFDAILESEGYTQTITGINSTKHATCGVDMTVMFEESDNKNNVSFNQIVSCVRNYKTYATDITPVTAESFVVPFVTLPFVSVAAITEELKKFGVAIQGTTSKREIKQVGTLGDAIVYDYKLLTCIYSNVLAQELNLTTPTSNTLKYSFGVEWTNIGAQVEILKNLYDLLNTQGISVNLKDVIVSKKIKNVIPAVAIWQNVLDKSQNDKYELKDYYYLVRTFITELHAENEKRAVRQEERLQGLPLYMFYTVLSDWLNKRKQKLTTHLYQEIYAYLISLWDVGIANYNVDVYNVDGQQYIGGCIVDGEQAFYAMLEPGYKIAADVVSCINTLHNYSGNVYSRTISNLARIQDKLYNIVSDTQKLDFVISYYKEHKTVAELMIAGMYTVETARKWYSIIDNELHQI